MLGALLRDCNGDLKVANLAARPRVLCITPYDPRTSEGNAGGQFLRDWVRMLMDSFEVTVVTWSTSDSEDGYFERIPVVVFRCGATVSRVGRLRDGLGPPSQFSRWLRLGSGRRYLDAADLIEVQWPGAIGLLRSLKPYTQKPVAYVTHDLRSEALASLAISGDVPTVRAVAVAKLARCLLQETIALRSADQIWCFRDTERDLMMRWRIRATIDVVSPSFPLVDTLTLDVPRRRGDELSLVCVADMSRLENKIAVSGFVKNIWPTVYRQLPTARLSIVGRCDNPDYLFRNTARGVHWLGWVDDLAGIYRESDAAIVPSCIKGGIKFKVAEALAYGVPVVSTPTGSDGYPKSLDGIAVAARPDEWVLALSRIPSMDDAVHCPRRRRAERLNSVFSRDHNGLLANERYLTLLARAS